MNFSIKIALLIYPIEVKGYDCLLKFTEYYLNVVLLACIIWKNRRHFREPLKMLSQDWVNAGGFSYLLVSYTVSVYEFQDRPNELQYPFENNGSDCLWTFTEYYLIVVLYAQIRWTICLSFKKKDWMEGM